MSYQVIARRWRPQSFTEVVGQSHITQTLVNALKNGRVPHALLFTGPRGTGKTSSARILAKALRCPNAVDFVPCNHCDVCNEVTGSHSVDVIEIDGASNNGVDAIRELREGVAFMPSSGKYKVYIIDEVHMLSTSAFNALLKTLEEPPAHVIFIMATTEVHKIPQTILSRCQRFDFRRISTKQITERLRLICEHDGVKAEDDALWVIARQGDGSMRDSLSLLDQVITFASGDLTKENVVEILGLTDRSLLLETLHGLLHRDTQAILAVIKKLATTSFEPALFAQDLLEIIRHLLIVKISADHVTDILDLPDSEVSALREFAQAQSEQDIHMLFDMALKGGQDIPRAQDPRLVLEVVLLRMAQAPRLLDIQALLQGGDLPAMTTPGAISAGQKPFAGLKPQSSAQGHQRLNEAQKVSTVPKELAAMKSALEKKSPEIGAQSSQTAPVSNQEPQSPRRLAQGATVAERWVDFVDLIRNDEALFAAKVENLLFVKEEGQLLTLQVPPKLVFLREQMSDSQIRKKLQGFIDSYWGAGYSFEVLMNKDNVAGQSAQGLIQKKVQAAEAEIREKVMSHPKVLAAQSVFKGQIKSITDFKEKP